jgi:ArsR family transcriptional regulator, arsenate/arsenite/antimonite-responsive transcriptional repressor
MRSTLLVTETSRRAPGSSFHYDATMNQTQRAVRLAPGCGPAEPGEPDLRPVEGETADREIATLTKALGHPTRVQIMRLLVRREACICGDIVDELPLAQSTVSQHLKVLKEAGLIRGEIDGPRVCYCVEPRALRRLKALVGSL